MMPSRMGMGVGARQGRMGVRMGVSVSRLRRGILGMGRHPIELIVRG